MAARAIVGVGTGLAFISGSALVRESGGWPARAGRVRRRLACPGRPRAGRRAAARGGARLARALLDVARAGAARARGRVRAGPGRRRSRRGPPARRRACSGTVAFYRLAILYAASYGLGVVLANWVVELLQRHGDMSDGAAAAVGALTLLLVVVSRPLGGWILLARPRQTRARGGGEPGGRARRHACAPGRRPGLACRARRGARRSGGGHPLLTRVHRRRRDAAATRRRQRSASSTPRRTSWFSSGRRWSAWGSRSRVTAALGFAVLALLWVAALAALPSQVALGVRTAASP